MLFYYNTFDPWKSIFSNILYFKLHYIITDQPDWKVLIYLNTICEGQTLPFKNLSSKIEQIKN